MFRAIVAKSGVPRGSDLGSLLFILFINDVVDIFKHPRSQFLLYTFRKLGWNNRFESSSYGDRCAHTDLESLADWRRNACVLFVFDI